MATERSDWSRNQDLFSRRYPLSEPFLGHLLECGIVVEPSWIFGHRDAGKCSEQIAEELFLGRHSPLAVICCGSSAVRVLQRFETLCQDPRRSLAHWILRPRFGHESDTDINSTVCVGNGSRGRGCNPSIRTRTGAASKGQIRPHLVARRTKVFPRGLVKDLILDQRFSVARPV